MTPLDAALDYARLGLRVIPIAPGRKFPAGIEAWQDAATNDAYGVADLWERRATWGVGIATGVRSGVWVLDVDVADDKTGDDTLAELEHVHGPLPETVECLTGSGGRHIYFAWADGIRNDAGSKLGPGLDVRGEGGQVLAPPTVHPNGRPYEWLADHAPGDVPFAEAPAWLIQLLTEAPCSSLSSSLSPSSSPSSSTQRPVTDDGPAARYNEAHTWHEILTADGWTHDHTDRDGEQHWTRPGKDGRDGTSATVGHAGGDGLVVFTTSLPWLPPAAYSRFGYYAARHHGGDRSAAARALRATEDSDRPDSLTWLREAQTGAQTAQAGDEGLSPGDNPDKADDNPFRLALIDWPKLYAEDRPEAEWLLEPVIARGRGHALYAGAKGGKSFILLAGCAALAAGQPFLAHPGGTPVDVLYIDYEMTDADVLERLQGFGYHDPDGLSHLHYSLLPAAQPLDTTEGGLKLVQMAYEVGAQLVIIDTTSRAVEGAENDADTYRAMYRHVGQPLKALGIAWVRLDHAGKELDRGQRGSSGKNDDVDVVWEWKPRPDKTGGELRATHRRMGWVPDKVVLDVAEDDAGLWHIASPEIESPTYDPGVGDIVEDLERLGVPREATVRRAVEALRDAGMGRRTRLVGQAVKFRKTDKARAGIAFLVGSRDAKPGTAEPTPTNTGGNDTGTAGNSPGGKRETVCVPIGTHGSHALPERHLGRLI